MMTLQEVLDDQRDLSKLCAKRGNPTVDAFGGNGFYGVADIYKTYAGVPLNKPLNGIVPHGFGFDPKWFFKEEASAPVPYVYCYPDFRQEVYKRRTNKKIIPSASPFVYVVEMLKNQPKPERQGTLFLPLHSTKFITVQQNYKELANLLLALDEKYQPVHVCMYWTDYLSGAAKPLQAKGIPIVSAGNMYDRLFMYRLYHLYSQYQYTSSNLQGGSLLYGVKAGCIFFHTKLPFEFTGSARALRRDVMDINNKYLVRLGRAFAPRSATTNAFLWEERNETTTPEQKEIVDRYLGTAHFKTREQMRRDLLRT